MHLSQLMDRLHDTGVPQLVDRLNGAGVCQLVDRLHSAPESTGRQNERRRCVSAGG